MAGVGGEVRVRGGGSDAGEGMAGLDADVGWTGD